MADWLGINSSHIDSLCGEDDGGALADALNGTGLWKHFEYETHFFIIDLGKVYNINKVRARSLTSEDPIDVNIYVSNDKDSWGAAVKTGITTWQDTSTWIEIDVTGKKGRYLKVEIIDTEEFADNLQFGDASTPFTIFDVNGEVVSKRRARSGLRIIENGDRLRGLRKDSPY
ncbi:hypothetical protein LCGC14_1164340 [marine sediment metagenome]|uniref:F5/8 type C domain-containing protein n=1 Tax=marine sediment metagenome TaxID=412755 RepID=A0A0F9MEQ6_9ZZZZ